MQAEALGGTPHHGLDRPGIPRREPLAACPPHPAGVPSGTWGHFARCQGGAKGSEEQVRRRAH